MLGPFRERDLRIPYPQGFGIPKQNEWRFKAQAPKRFVDPTIYLYYSVYIMPDTDSALPVILPVRLDPQLAQELDAVRGRRDMSRNAFVIEVLKAALLGQSELKFRVAELALREFQVFVIAAEEGGVLDNETAKSLNRVLVSARASVDQMWKGPKTSKGLPQKAGPHSPHGLALAETERLREFVDRFRALCASEHPAQHSPVRSNSPRKSKKSEISTHTP